MMINKKLPLALAVSSLVALAGCGGSGSDSGSNPGSTATTVTGTASAPAGAVARLEPFNPLQIAASFLVSPANAGITGLQPVTGAKVELIRVDDNGDQIGDVLAETATSISGNYKIDLPEGVSLAGNLIVRITGQNNSEMRAQVVEKAVNISPVSEFVLRSFIKSGADLDALKPGAVVSLSGAVEDFDMTAGANLDEMFKTLEQVAGEYVETKIADISAGTGDATSISGDYRSSAMGFGLHDNDDSSNGTFALDYYTAPFNFTGSANGTVAVTIDGEESAYASLSGTSIVGAWVEYSTDIDTEVEELDATFNANNVLMITGEFEEEFEGGDDYGFRYPAANYPLQKLKDQNLFFVQAQDGAVRYAAIDTDEDNINDAIDPNQKLGDEAFRSIEVFAKMPTSASAADLDGEYGRVFITSKLSNNGPIELETENNVLDFDGAGTTEYGAVTGDTLTTSGYTATSEAADPNPLSYSVTATGDLNVDGSEGFINDTGSFIVFGEPEGTDGDDAALGTTMMVKLPTTAPTVTGKTYRLMFVGIGLSGNEIQMTNTSFGSTIAMTSETAAVAKTRSTEITKAGLSGQLEVDKNDESTEDATVSIAANGEAQIVVGGPGESTFFTGYFNETGSLGIFRTAYLEGPNDPEELGMAILIELP
ncbi:hypothetical protein ACTXGQ_16625 [Marinobacter sp. 1Y8]